MLSIGVIACCTLLQIRERLEQPDLRKISSKGISHQAGMAAEVLKLRQELELKPSTAVQVIDHGHTFYITDDVHLLYKKRYGTDVVPETEHQDAEDGLDDGDEDNM